MVYVKSDKSRNYDCMEWLREKFGEVKNFGQSLYWVPHRDSWFQSNLLHS